MRIALTIALGATAAAAAVVCLHASLFAKLLAAQTAKLGSWDPPAYPRPFHELFYLLVALLTAAGVAAIAGTWLWSGRAWAKIALTLAALVAWAFLCGVFSCSM